MGASMRDGTKSGRKRNNMNLRDDPRMTPSVMNQGRPNNPIPEQATTLHDQQAFPSEPFACPNCGQMLGATVRVCVACKQAVDPVMIKSIPIELPRELPRAARSSERVYFPWTLFFALFAVRILVIGGIVVVRHWDFSKIALDR